MAVVDAPGITEPDDALPVKSVVGEELAIAGKKAGGKAVQAWLEEHDWAEYADKRFEHLPVGVRTELLAELTVARPDVKVVILTMPDRLGGDPHEWYELGRDLASRGYGVIITCADASARLLGVKAAQMGSVIHLIPSRWSRSSRPEPLEPEVPVEEDEDIEEEGRSMTSIRMAMSELRRLTAGRLPKLAVVALLCVPMLYGGLYLYANHDPYGRLDKVPTAVVVEDAGTTLSTGEKLSVGPQVADELVKSKSFDWHRVDRADAAAGVTNGKYEFALILPKTFSSDLASSAEFEPRQANLELLTNDANNYLAHTIANQVVAQVTKSVAAQVSETAASKLLAGFSTIHGQITKAATGAGQLQTGLTDAGTGVGKLQTGAGQLNTAQKQLSAGATKLSTGLGQAGRGAGDLATGASQLSTGLSTLQTKTASLPSQTSTLANGAEQVADGNEKIAGVGQQVATASSTLLKDLTTLDAGLADRLKAKGFTQAQINQVLAETAKLRGPVVTANTKIQSTSKQLNQLATGARQVSNGATALANATPALTSGIKSAATGAGQLSTGASQLKTGVGTLQTGAAQLATGEQQAVTGQGQLLTGVNSLATGIGKLKTGASELNTALTNGAKQIPDPSPEARKAVAETLGAPVGLKNSSQATADSSALDWLRSSSACPAGSARTSSSCWSGRCRREHLPACRRRYGSHWVAGCRPRSSEPSKPHWCSLR